MIKALFILGLVVVAFAHSHESSSSTDTDSTSSSEDTDLDTDTDSESVCELLEEQIFSECFVDGCVPENPDELCCDTLASFLNNDCDSSDSDEGTDSSDSDSDSDSKDSKSSESTDDSSSSSTDTDSSSTSSSDESTDSDSGCYQPDSAADAYYEFCQEPQDCQTYEAHPAIPSCCVENRHEVGDGKCDLNLNVPECLYDGGDCCAESCLDTVEECGSGRGFDCRDPNPEPWDCSVATAGILNTCGSTCFPVVATAAGECCTYSENYVDGSCSLFEDQAEHAGSDTIQDDDCSRTCSTISDCFDIACGATCTDLFDAVEAECVVDDCFDATPGIECCDAIAASFDDTTCFPEAAQDNDADFVADADTCEADIANFEQLYAPCIVDVLEAAASLAGVPLSSVTPAILGAFKNTIIDQLGISAKAYVFYSKQAATEKAAGDAVINYGILQLEGVDLDTITASLADGATLTSIVNALNTAFQAIDPSLTVSNLSVGTTRRTPATPTPTATPTATPTPTPTATGQTTSPASTIMPTMALAIAAVAAFLRF